MNIIKNRKDQELTIVLQGRLDTLTSPELERQLMGELDGVEVLIFDFAELEYVSSAGLRVILATRKAMNGEKKMEIIHVNDVVMEVFEMTGFTDILEISR